MDGVGGCWWLRIRSVWARRHGGIAISQAVWVRRSEQVGVGDIIPTLERVFIPLDWIGLPGCWRTRGSGELVSGWGVRGSWSLILAEVLVLLVVGVTWTWSRDKFYRRRSVCIVQ